nr:glycosyltransferase family 4 protein [Salinibacter ruber]
MEKVFSQLCKRLCQRSYDVHSMYRAERFKKVEGAHTTSWDLPLEHLRTWNKLPRPGSIFSFMKDLRRLSRIIGQIQPDIVNCHFASFYVSYFCLLKPLHGYRLVISTHGRDLAGGMSAMQRAVRPYLLRTADHVTAVSADLETQIKQEAGGRTRATTIPNGVDIEFWSAEEKSKGKETNPTIINVGALRGVKGQDILLRAFPKILSAHPSTQLWFAGDGETRQDLEALASRLGVSDHVTFHGWCSTEKVRDLLQAATLFVMPSRSEGFGIALVEAMAAGLPVVASNVGGVPDIVESGTSGILVPPDNAETLAEGILKILQDEEYGEELATIARERAQDFRLNDALDEYERVLRKVTSE